MKIAITGAQGVGKSTLASAISEQLNLPLITEGARKYEIPDTYCDQLLTVQKSILNDQIKLEKDYTDIYGSFVSDRSTIDNMAYWLNNCLGHSANNDADYIYKCRCNLQTYTHIFYVPIEIELVDDGFRNLDKRYQKLIDDKIIQILNRYSVKYYTITGTLEDRVQKILKMCDI